MSFSIQVSTRPYAAKRLPNLIFARANGGERAVVPRSCPGCWATSAPRSQEPPSRLPCRGRGDRVTSVTDYLREDWSHSRFEEVDFSLRRAWEVVVRRWDAARSTSSSASPRHSRWTARPHAARVEPARERPRRVGPSAQLRADRDLGGRRSGRVPPLD